MNSESKKGRVILVSRAKGDYIPQVFAENFQLVEWGVPEAREVLKAGPVNDKYWEVWESVLNNARFTDPAGHVYQLHHDGGLWAVCRPLLTEEERAGFFEVEGSSSTEEASERSLRVKKYLQNREKWHCC